MAKKEKMSLNWKALPDSDFLNYLQLKDYVFIFGIQEERDSNCLPHLYGFLSLLLGEQELINDNSLVLNLASALTAKIKEIPY